MNSEEYVKALAEAEAQLRTNTVDLTMLSVLLKKSEADVIKLETQLKDIKKTLAYSKSKAKIVNLQEFSKAVKSLDICKKILQTECQD